MTFDVNGNPIHAGDIICYCSLWRRIDFGHEFIAKIISENEFYFDVDIIIGKTANNGIQHEGLIPKDRIKFSKLRKLSDEETIRVLLANDIF
ncbi:Uncharacterised protein [uncultured archaeon]|nr:Uncharacterised protein [uncultured archaeon]